MEEIKNEENAFNPDYEYVDRIDIPEVEKGLNNIVLSDELIENVRRFVEADIIDGPVCIQKYKDVDDNEYEKTVTVGTTQIGCSITEQQMNDLSTQWGIDVHKMIGNAIKNETVVGVNNYITSRLFSLGWAHNITIDNVGGYTVKDGVSETPVYAYVNPNYQLTEEPQEYNISKSLSVVKKNDLKSICLQVLERYINNSYKNSYPEYLLTNISLIIALQFDKEIELSEKYSVKCEPISNMLSSASIYHPLNLIVIDKNDNTEHTIKCYCDPLMSGDDTRILLGRISKDYEGCKFALYKAVDDLKMLKTYTKDENGNRIDKSSKIVNKSRYTLVECEHKLLTAMKNYMTLFISI